VLYEIGPGFGQAPAWAANDTLMTLHVARARALVYPGELMQYGRLAVSLGRLADGREAYERAAVLQPRNAPLQVALGMACVRLDDLGAGLAAFERAEALDPSNPDARIGQGWALLLARRPQAAAAAWRPVVAQTRDSDTLRRMVELYRMLGDREAEAGARAALARTEAGR
jgi:cytochrome c-type biogenesis protein CcmH/NrfG